MQTALRLSIRPASSSSSSSDETLITLIAKSDKRAMEILFGRHHVRVHRFATRIVGDATLAEDIMSDVFLEVWRCAGQFRARSQVSTWLLAITRHKSLAELRRRRDVQWEDEEQTAVADAADDPETMAHQSSCGAILRRCLMRLPPRQRELIDLVYYHEKTISEVAEITGLAEGTVKTRMFHARKRLAGLLRSWRIEAVQTN